MVQKSGQNLQLIWYKYPIIYSCCSLLKILGGLADFFTINSISTEKKTQVHEVWVSIAHRPTAGGKV